MHAQCTSSGEKGYINIFLFVDFPKDTDGDKLASTALHRSVLCNRTGHRYLGIQEVQT